MARPSTAKFGKMRILLGDGGSPETFSAPCGLTGKGISLSKDLSEVNIPDCDDPDKPDWKGRDVQSLSMEITGEGVLAAESVSTWLEAAYSIESINAKVEVEFSQGETLGLLTFLGAFHVASFSVNGSSGERVQSSISLQSDGEVPYTWAPV